MTTQRTAWTAEQMQLLAEHWTLPDGAVKPMLDAIGPPRTIKAIAYQRRAQGFKKQPGASAPHMIEMAAAGLSIARERQAGWPIMCGKPAQRERRYQRALWEDLLAEHKRSRGEA